MILRLDIERLRTLEEVRDFLAGSEPVDFHFTDRRGAYDFVTRALRRLNYSGLSKADKGVVRRFVAKVTDAGFRGPWFRGFVVCRPLDGSVWGVLVTASST